MGEALDDFAQASVLQPKVANYHVLQAVAHLALKDHRAALHEFNVAEKLNPNFSEYKQHYALLLASSPVDEVRDGDKAITLAEQICKASLWENWADISILAAAFADVSNFGEAVRWAERALELAPEDQREIRESRLAQFKRGEPYRDAGP